MDEFSSKTVSEFPKNLSIRVKYKNIPISQSKISPKVTGHVRMAISIDHFVWE